MNHKNYFRIEKAIRYLNQNYDERPQWNDLARHLRLSPYHFHRLFRSWAGISPKQFLQYLTIQHAKDLLKRSKSLMDASYDSGLSGPGRLHDLFVTFDAMTPGEYKSRGKGLKIEYGIHASPFGDCLIAVTERGICHLSFVPDRGAASAKKELRSRWKNAALAENPARIFGLYPRKGTIRVGSDADLLIYDPHHEGEIRVADHRGIAGWTLYEGWKQHGRPWMTLLRGKTLLKDGKLEQAPGYGAYLHRGAPLPPLAGSVR